MKLTIIHAIRPNNPSQKTQSLLGLEVVLILRNPLSHTHTHTHAHTHTHIYNGSHCRKTLALTPFHTCKSRTLNVETHTHTHTHTNKHVLARTHARTHWHFSWESVVFGTAAKTDLRTDGDLDSMIYFLLHVFDFSLHKIVISFVFKSQDNLITSALLWID